MVEFEPCRIPLIVTCFLVLLSNAGMVKSICFNNERRSVDFIFGAIGFSNVTLCLLLILRAIFENDTDNRYLGVEVAGLSAVVSLYFMQLGTNIALAYDRYVAVSQPMRYRVGSWFSVLKKLLLGGLITTIACSAAMACVAVLVLHKVSYLLKVVGISRLVGSVSFAIIYYRIFHAYKASQTSLGIDSTSKQNVRIEANKIEIGVSAAMRQIKAKRERSLMKMCIGITVSFIIFNLPVMIYNGFFGFGEDCNTTQGKLLVASVTMMSINMLLDPCWYFKMVKRG